MPKSFTRLDKLLVDRGLVPSRERAQALILSAKVLLDGQRATKAGLRVSSESRIELIGDDIPYVSRGGIKLEHAIRTFKVDVAGRVAMDVGASTGGFTDCLLQSGAKRVYAVDVGYGQLDWKLRQDERVVVLERQNIRYLPTDLVPEPIQVAVVDASFISLKLVLPPLIRFLELGSTLIALIKPQFEAGRSNVGKGGVVRDPAVHDQVCDSLVEFSRGLGFSVRGVTPSPILGPKGNREFLMVAVYGGNTIAADGPSHAP